MIAFIDENAILWPSEYLDANQNNVKLFSVLTR